MDRSSIKKSRTKMTPKNWIGFLYSLSLSVCLFVCLSVASLQVTVFVVGSWILARGTLEWIPQFFICFLKCWDLIYLLLFLDFFGVFFAIYPLLILKESVDRTKWHRDLKCRIWDLYMAIYRSMKYFFNIIKITSSFVAKTYIDTKIVILNK